MHATNSRLPATRRSHHAMGFSLIELLVVIAIIVVIIAITVPALASARKAAKRSETANLLTDLSQGVAQFTLDEKRQPGYFTVKEMGSQANMTQGMTTMQNVMLDMLGGVEPTGTALGGTVVAVGPFTAAAQKVPVDIAKMGRKTASGNKLYWNLPAKVFEKTDPITGQPIDTGLPSRIGTHKPIREIVDAFGAPILGWAADESISTPIVNVDDFAKIYDDSTAAQPSRARVYWASNSAFLSDGVFLGTKQLNQRGIRGNENPPEVISMLHGSLVTSNQAEVQETLMGLLGNPGSPKNPAETDLELIRPTAPLAPLVFHSAGVDGYILSRNDRAGKLAHNHGAQAVLGYGQNVKDKILEKSDDIIQGAN